MVSKRMKASHEKFSAVDSPMALKNAVELSCQSASAKFEEGFDIALHLGVDPRKYMVRGASTMPNGLGKTKRIAVFASGDQAEAAKKAGALKVGMEELAEEMKKSADYDVVISTPEAMKFVGKLGKVLGPKGLMPNPKVGTVTEDAGLAVATAMKGQVIYKVDKAGIVHCTVGKCKFTPEALIENITQLIVDIKKAKPAAAKGQYLKKMYVNSTMGPSILVDLSSVS
jgi:large subunit ribosomal protein L1